MDKKEVFDYTVHYRMPRIRFPKKRRRTKYKGIVNQQSVESGDLSLSRTKHDIR